MSTKWLLDRRIEGFCALQAPVNIADPEDPLLQAQVSANGELHVTGNVTLSGTSKVEVTNTPLPVDVANFPATQNVHVVGGSSELAPVAGLVYVVFDVNSGGGVVTHTFSTFNVTSVMIQSPLGDEMQVGFRTPLASPPLFGFVFYEGDQESFVHDFVHPIPMNGVTVHCTKSHTEPDCNANVTLVGF